MTRRTTLEIDEDRLRAAQGVLGTKGLKDTVHRALDEVVRADLRRRLADRLTSGAGFDTDELSDEARRRRWHT